MSNHLGLQFGTLSAFDAGKMPASWKHLEAEMMRHPLRLLRSLLLLGLRSRRLGGLLLEAACRQDLDDPLAILEQQALA